MVLILYYVQVMVEAGAVVQKGQPLIKMESMKMHVRVLSIDGALLDPNNHSYRRFSGLRVPVSSVASTSTRAISSPKLPSLSSSKLRRLSPSNPAAAVIINKPQHPLALFQRRPRPYPSSYAPTTSSILVIQRCRLTGTRKFRRCGGQPRHLTTHIAR